MNPDLSIAETEKEIIEEFALFDSWDDKYEYIIDLGKKLPPLDLKYKTDENRVRGCQSSVWLVADYENGKLILSCRQRRNDRKRADQYADPGVVRKNTRRNH